MNGCHLELANQRQVGLPGNLEPDNRNKMKVFLALVIAMLVMAVTGVSAAEAPAPGPSSDATTLFLPTAFASLFALAFALLF
ncbi:hypothetical protein VNO78_16960 [Psophocarpus tetragonolobus]|uniref:Arabinogalactan peptide 14 n=1 Tax=Psophocarpus tetragonolobus TaxID=3891 RepID=A0AAN9SHA8_PSOTE